MLRISYSIENSPVGIGDQGRRELEQELHRLGIWGRKGKEAERWRVFQHWRKGVLEIRIDVSSFLRGATKLLRLAWDNWGRHKCQ